MPVYEYKCPDCGFLGSIERRITSKIPKKWKCPECGSKMHRHYGSINLVFRGEGWPGQEIKRKNEDDKIFTKARIARRLKASGAVPMEETILEKDVDASKFHGDLSMKELQEKRCDYQGRKPKKKKDSGKEK